MNTLKAAFFDLDGTLIDTEEQYTEFWGTMGQTYLPLIPTFAHDIKGTTLRQIFDRYFPSEELRKSITMQLDEWEAHMDYRIIAGAENFLKDLRKHGVLCAVVTSSNQKKLESVKMRIPQFMDSFDFILTSEDFRASKPSPDCYLTAAKVCKVQTDECVVFEDAFTGLQAGTSSGIMTIGLCTTNPRSAIENRCDYVLDNFIDLTAECVEEWLTTFRSVRAERYK